jgi:hypothetical protein
MILSSAERSVNVFAIYIRLRICAPVAPVHVFVCFNIEDDFQVVVRKSFTVYVCSTVSVCVVQLTI